MIMHDSYDPTIESTHHKTIRFRKVHFATDIVDTAGMVCTLYSKHCHEKLVTTPVTVSYNTTKALPNGLEKSYVGAPSGTTVLRQLP